VESARGIGEAAHHEAVPSGENLLVATGTYAPLSRAVQDAFGALDRRAQLGHGNAVRLRECLRLVWNVEDVAALEVALCCHAPVRREELRVFAEE
jgi:hypothetical protein